MTPAFDVATKGEQSILYSSCWTQKVNLMQSRYLFNYFCIEQIKIRITMKMLMPQTTRDKRPIKQHNWFGDPKPNSQKLQSIHSSMFRMEKKLSSSIPGSSTDKLKIYIIAKSTTGTLQTSDGLQVLDRAIGTETSKL